MRSPDYQRSRNERQVKRITAALTESPMTRNQLAAKLYLSGYSIIYYMRQMRRDGLVYIAGHFHHAKKGQPAPIYALGNLPDAVYDPASRVKPDTKPGRPAAAIRQAEALQHLKAAHSSEQLGKRMFVSQARARFYIGKLKAEGKVYILRWDAPPARGDQIPVYMAGKRKDAVKVQQTRAERYKLEMANPEKAERIITKKRAAYACQKASSKKQSIFAALGI